MNTELIHEVADTIERLEYGYENGQFSMAGFIHLPTEDNPDSCQSPACIAGWTCHIADGEVPADDSRLDEDPLEEHPVHKRAAELLGISPYRAYQLFMPMADSANHWTLPRRDGHISPERAAATLRRLADTGVVDWGPPAA